MVGTFICFPLKAYLPFTEQTDYCKHLLYDIELCTVRTKSGLSGGDDSLDFDECWKYSHDVILFCAGINIHVSTFQVNFLNDSLVWAHSCTVDLIEITVY